MGEVSGVAAERRLQVARVVWRIAADQGLEAVSFRSVAAAAGVSVRVVQYHFGSKHQLLVDSLHLLHETNERAAQSRTGYDGTDPRRVLLAIFEEFLPADEQRRLSLRALSAYYARSLTDPALAAVFLTGDRSLEELVAMVLNQAAALGQLHPYVDPVSTADLLVAGVTGLSMDVVHGTRSARDVRAIAARQLDQLFCDVPGLSAESATRR